MNKCPRFIDALAGLGECFKLRGDKSVTGGDAAEAEEYYSKAKNYFQQVMDLDVTQNASKKLTRREKNALNYSLAYTKVRLYETGGGLDNALLTGAKKDFNKIQPDAAEYIKSKKAAKLIGQKISPLSKAQKYAPSLVYIFAILILIGTQIVVIDHYFRKDKKEYVINRDAFAASIKKSGLDSAALMKKMTPLFIKKFTDREQLEKTLIAGIDQKLLQAIDAGIISEKTVAPSEGLDNVSYGFFTFGALLFMVVGLFLPFISKLKVGSIEMEKSAADTVKTNTSILQKS